MAKRPLKIAARIPEYCQPRNAWRKRIIKAVREKQGDVRYHTDDRLEVEVVLYMGKRGISWNDVDNRSKDVLDALQGRVGGPKGIRPLNPIIPNDRAISRLIVEKKLPPKQSRGLGHVRIRKLAGIKIGRSKRKS